MFVTFAVGWPIRFESFLRPRNAEIQKVHSRVPQLLATYRVEYLILVVGTASVAPAFSIRELRQHLILKGVLKHVLLEALSSEGLVLCKKANGLTQLPEHEFDLGVVGRQRHLRSLLLEDVVELNLIVPRARVGCHFLDHHLLFQFN